MGKASKGAADAAQYRTGSPNPLGKFDDKIDGIKFWAGPKAILRQQAVDAGYSNLQDYLRDLLLIKAYGADHLKRLHAERIDRAAGKGEESTAQGRAEGNAQ